MKKLLSTAANVVLIALILAIAGLSLATTFPIPGISGDGKLEVKIVQSGSMEPAIHTGGIVVIQPKASYGVGDVVTFGADTKTEVPTTHRIVSMRTENGVTLYTTKGDANEDVDAGEVAATAVIGEVIFTAPYVGYLLDFAKQPLGFALLIVIPAALIILHEVWGIVEELRGRGRKGAKRKETGESVPLRKIRTEEKQDRIFYTRLSAMDDIYRPQRFHSLTIAGETTAVRHKTPTLLAGAFAMIALPSFGFALAYMGGTTSAFSDIEKSVGNLLSAAVLDFTVDADAPRAIALDVGEGEEGATTFTPFVIDIDGSLPFAYKVVAEETGGDSAFCNALHLVGSSTPFVYDGLLLALDTATTSDQSPWTVSLYSDTVFPDGTTCMVDLVYRGAQEGSDPEEEYHDEERLPLLITFVAPVAPLLKTLSVPEEGEGDILPPPLPEVLGTTTEDIPPEDTSADAPKPEPTPDPLPEPEPQPEPDPEPVPEPPPAE